MNRLLACLGLMFALAQLLGCGAVPRASDDDAPQVAKETPLLQTPWTVASSYSVGTPAWEHFKLPGKKPTQFTYTRMDGRDAMAVMAISSASMLRQAVRLEPAELDNVRFSWKVPALIQGADMAVRDSDDSPVRIVLAFEGDRSKFSAKNSMLSELSRAITGEEMPYATLMYVWCNNREPGSVIVNPRTDRIRKIVVQSGGKQLNQWLDYKRNIREDYERAFGEAPGALVGIGIMTDSDNTHSTAKAWYGPVKLSTMVAGH